MLTTTPTIKSRCLLAKIITDVARMPGAWAVATSVPCRGVYPEVLAHAGHLTLVDDTGRAVAAVGPSFYGTPWGYVVFPIAPDDVRDLPGRPTRSDVVEVPYKLPVAEAARRIVDMVPRLRQWQDEAREFVKACHRYRAEAAEIVASAARRLGDPDPQVHIDDRTTGTEPWAYWHCADAKVIVGHNGLLTITISVTSDDLDSAFDRLPTIDKSTRAPRPEVG